MLNRCANQACTASFRRFGIGKLFRVDRRNTSPPLPSVDFYWLCPVCAASMTLVIGADAAPTVIRNVAVEKAAAASV
jgi:hypothetical protein